MTQTQQRNRQTCQMRWTHLSSICMTAIGCILVAASGAGAEEASTVTAVMPAYDVTKHDSYLCTVITLPKKASKLVGIDPLSKKEVVHHMLLFGCSGEPHTEEVWDCQMQSVCKDGHDRVLYGWGKNAPAMQLPEGVGYGLGEGSSISHLVLQIHYLESRPPNDQSGIRLTLSPEQVPFAAGMINFASSFSIEPRKESTLVPNQCCYNGHETLHGFAFRVHTHALGRQVYLDRLSGPASHPEHLRLVEYSPQLPQGFNPIDPNLVLRPGQRIEATCDFDSRDQERHVHAGATHADEMCNLYMMVWSQRPVFMTCINNNGHTQLHDMGGVPTAANLVLDEDWTPPSHMGQVAGVTKGSDSTIWAVHRGGRVWDMGTYSGGGAGERVTDESLLPDDVVVQLDQDTGKVLTSWGAETFNLPHMVSLDPEGNVWVVDTGLHQALKFSPDGRQLLALGQRFEPGHDAEHLCKPTQVAVANDGTIYVSDGYCNSRVMEYAADGTYQGEFKLAQGAIAVSHSLVLDECEGALIVADRENAKVHRFSLETRQWRDSWDVSKYGAVYALARGPYGSTFALTWKHDHPDADGQLVLLAASPSSGVEAAWTIAGAKVPHDIVLTAAPVYQAGVHEQPLAVFVTETRPAGSRLLKYTLLPEGSVPVKHIELDAADEAVLRTASHVHGHSDPGATHGSSQSHEHAAADGSDAQRDVATSRRASEHPEVGDEEGDTHFEAGEAEPLEHVPFIEGDGTPALEAIAEATEDVEANTAQPFTTVVKDDSLPADDELSGGEAAAAGQHAQRHVPTMDHDMGSPDYEMQDAVAFKAAIQQLFTMGLPFAALFGILALFLWRRLGSLEQLPTRSSDD